MKVHYVRMMWYVHERWPAIFDGQLSSRVSRKEVYVRHQARATTDCGKRIAQSEKLGATRFPCKENICI